jgi:hypothetical protein
MSGQQQQGKKQMPVWDQQAQAARRTMKGLGYALGVGALILPLFMEPLSGLAPLVRPFTLAWMVLLIAVVLLIHQFAPEPQTGQKHPVATSASGEDFGVVCLVVVFLESSGGAFSPL